MMGLSTIVSLNEGTGKQAKREGRLPWVPEAPAEIAYANMPECGIPNLGYYVPKGWKKLAKTWFVDKSGMGQRGEAALTINDFLAELRAYAVENPTHGYAMCEEGEFQTYVGVYAPKKGKHA